ncbi:hypothetical protein GBA52_026341 [Prunus armeniaca]|nr:hypothetical protein GBA52_026341 [Prunus armeniaca]
MKKVEVYIMFAEWVTRCIWHTDEEKRRVLQEYSERMREMGIQLLRGISKSLGLEECYIEKKVKLESGYNILGPNFYQSLSRCSDDKNQIGQFPHRDPGLLVLIAQNVEVERSSLPFFFGPSLDATVKPEPEFVDDHNPPSCRQMTYKEYLESNSQYHVIEAKANLINEALL